MDLFNNITFSFNFKELPYQRLPDVQFGSNDKNVLGEMYNDAMIYPFLTYITGKTLPGAFTN